MNLTYPAIITKEKDIFYISFPNFDEDIYSTYGYDFYETIKMGKEYLVLKLEECNLNFPKPILVNKNNIKENQEIVFITLNYDYEKSLSKLNYVKKTLTIPAYLDILAKNKNINFSSILQQALKKELGIEK